MEMQHDKFIFRIFGEHFELLSIRQVIHLFYNQLSPIIICTFQA
jgi:hypothetical protein